MQLNTLLSPLRYLLQATQKKIKMFFRPNRSPRQQWPPRRKKNGERSIVFQSREQVVVRRGQIRRIGWVIKKMEDQVGQFLLECKCPVSRGIVVPEQDTFGEFPAAFFLQNVLHLHQKRWVILRVDSLALWKQSMRWTPSWFQKIEARNFPADFLTRNFLGRGEPLCRHSIDCCFVSGS